MKKEFVKGLVMLVMGLVLVAGNAMATTWTFDNVVGTEFEPGVKWISDGYGGFNWDNFAVMNPEAPGSFYGTNSGYGNGRVSGDWVAFNAYASVATASNIGFLFNGAYFTAAWNDDLNIDITGYDANGDVSHFQKITVDTDAATLFTFNWSDLYSLTFNSYGGTNAGLGNTGTHFAMDNFTTNDCCNCPKVPEPSTLLLFGSSLIGFAFFRRRK